MIFFLLLLASCGGSTDTGSPDTEVTDDLLVAPADGTTFGYLLDQKGGKPLHWPAAFGDGDYDGVTYTELTLGDFEAAEPSGVRAWMDFGDGTTADVGMRAIEVWGGGADIPILEYIFDPLVVVQLDGTRLGEPQDVKMSGSFVVFGNSKPMDIQATYTLTDVDATVEVPYGTVEGCWIYDVDMDDNGYALVSNLALKSGLGLVRSDMLPGTNAIELESVDAP
jgi:hypothetical protein